MATSMNNRNLKSFQACLCTRIGFVHLKNFTEKTSFSSSNLIGKCYDDVSIVTEDLFDNIQKALENPDGFDEETKMALTRLLDVMDKSKELLETLKVPQKTESKFNVFLACKVIQPLTGGTCIINSVKDEDKVAMTNSDVKLPDDFGLTGIAMGYEDGYYGEPDIIACPKEQSQNVGPGADQNIYVHDCKQYTPPKYFLSGPVMVACIASVFLELQRSEKPEFVATWEIGRAKNEERGRVAIDSVPSVEEPDETGASPDKVVIEGKKSVSEKTTISALSQTIAMALTFARIQQKRHSEHHTFPTLRVHPLGVDIILHNAVSDHLMLTCLAWSKSALFMLWLVLHHNLFSFRQVPKGYEGYTSGFLDYIEFSGAMKTEPKYLVLKNSFELNQEEIQRDYSIFF
ncbi:uncharacterized protein LOC110061932 isoform X3 [Orbicella faveolata]|uniref:uncharacterized protein LOC110061932 isoform X3 n=2 Tax=Orbicella faveolata TaxID=48498 RepID=UPI0009E496FC|nr:uncharacterized protein LOC110061932 isoform X3 [Orbicella faveolata]